jgi:hypothetical protein
MWMLGDFSPTDGTALAGIPDACFEQHEFISWYLLPDNTLLECSRTGVSR